MKHTVRIFALWFMVAVLNGGGVIRGLADASAAADAVEEASKALEQLDFKKAYKLLRPVAEAGDAWAQYTYGLLTVQGVGGKPDPVEACKWFKKSAEQGYASGQNGFGECYYQGQGVPKDMAKAVEWYRKSAEKGDAGGENNLGAMYEEGAGVPVDATEAVKWFERAAVHGNILAMKTLAKIYIEGKPELPKDYKLAFKWGLLANLKGYEQAYGIWRVAEEELTIRQLYEAKKEAREWAKLHPDAMKNMQFVKTPR